MRTARDTTLWILAMVLAAGGATRADGNPAALDRDDARGKFLYEAHCASCHGERGRGDGPAARALDPTPTDLTTLAGGADGEFPSERVATAIDGRSRIEAHGRSRMPVWGLAFQQLDRDTNQEDEVAQRIDHLIRYLESLQREP